MGGVDQPYLYDPPSRRQIAYPYSDFDPKAVTRASWISAAESTMSKPKKEGPLIDFNKHPDSFMVVTPQASREPMPANTKKKVTIVRWVQFGLRIIQVVGAIGCLLCVIFVRNTETAQGWIMRVPPAWDILVSSYGIYHLAYPPKHRTPASSSSYHIFGMMMDSGLIPFYVYTSWFAHQNWIAEPGSETRWRNIFNNDDSSTNPLLFATFLVSAITGFFHLITIGIGAWLAIIFRKISAYPPDLNPLEDNLTSRKHQYKNSDASAMSMMQKPGYMSGSTLNVNEQRFSKSSHDDRTLEFRHSRIGSENNFSPHNPRSAHLSRQQTAEQTAYQQPHDIRDARGSFAQTTRSASKSPEKRDCDSFSFVGSLASAPDVPPHTSQQRSHSPRPGSSVSVRETGDQQPQYAHTQAHEQSQQRESLLNDNWFVYDEPTVPLRDENFVAPAPPTPTHRRTPNFSRPSPVSSPDPERAARFSPMLSPLPPNHEAQFMPQPLRMNPPTPPNDDSILQNPPRHDSFQEAAHQSYEKYPDVEDNDDTSTIMGHEERQPLNETAVNRSHTNASAQSSQFAGSSVYSESAPSLRTANHKKSKSEFLESPNFKSVGAPRGKQYGDLASATRGIRQHDVYSQLPQEPQVSPRPYSNGYGLQADMPPSPPKHSPYNSGRVISRTGADIADEALYVPENASRRRYVSGKAAEEGMAGGRW
ncbi:hypothetical protein Q7P37_011623 [Cladosporium fusiforme]